MAYMESSVNVREAARWIASMAAADGVITPSERKLMREFAETYGIDVKSLYRMAYAIANQMDIPEVEFVDHSTMKGRMFEEFIVKLMADHSHYSIINWSSDKYADGIYSLDTLMPDLHIRHKLDECMIEYFMECKYRSSLPEGKLDISSQLGRYRRMTSAQPDRELFIALGLGGTPSDPERLYIIPNRMIRKDGIINLDFYTRCLCPQTPDGLHDYISHYFAKRVFRKQ